MANISDMLRYLRKREGLSQVELAKRTGISRSRINNYENGIREPDLETMEAFADYFNVNMDTLTGRIGTKNPTTANGDGNDALFAEMYSNFNQLPPEDREYIVSLINRLLHKGD